MQIKSLALPQGGERQHEKWNGYIDLFKYDTHMNVGKYEITHKVHSYGNIKKLHLPQIRTQYSCI